MAIEIPEARKVGMVSLGCPKALVDSERILTRLRADGYAMSADYAGADVVLVNTCGFLDSAKEESLAAIGEAIAENGRVIVTGCMGDEAETIRAKHRKRGSYHALVHMLTVANELRNHPGGFGSGTHHAGRAMQKRRHGVEEVGDMGHSRRNRSLQTILSQLVFLRFPPCRVCFISQRFQRSPLGVHCSPRRIQGCFCIVFSSSQCTRSLRHRLQLIT